MDDQLLDQVQQLCAREEDESSPYAFKYQAADLLRQAIKKAGEHQVQSEDAVSGHQSCGKQQISRSSAVLLAKKGLVLLQTDLLAEGEEDVHNALHTLEVSKLDNCSLVQECYNALGALYSNRGEIPTATAWLEKAENLYRQRLSSGHYSNDDVIAASRDQPEYSVESQYTSTLFFLAQVHGHAGDKTTSALYCGATLQRQLTSGEYELHDWVQNCLQLAGYYVACNSFAIAEYCLLATQQVIVQHVDKGGHIDEDVVANLELAWGKFLLGRLATSYDKYMAGRHVVVPSLDKGGIPDKLRFPALTLPPVQHLKWGLAALVEDFEGARELFNSSMTHMKKALEYYQLDGWVTEHCNILMNISNLYRCLAGFEPDVHRACIMHKHRAKRLEPVVWELNPEHFLGLLRSQHLELGNTYRDIMDLREARGNGGAKVASAGRDAAKHYQAFINTFKKDGKLPDHIDEDNERYFLMASFGLGRVLHKCDAADQRADRDIAMLAQAHTHLMWSADYVQKHHLTAYTQEADLAVEMAKLVAEKIDLLQQLRR